ALSAAEAQARQSVGRDRPDDERYHGSDAAHQQAVQQPAAEERLSQEEAVVLGDDSLADQEGNRFEIVQLCISLQRGDQHEVEGEQREEDKWEKADMAHGLMEAGIGSDGNQPSRLA